MGKGNENQKPVTDQYRSAWDQIFGKKPEPTKTNTDKPSDSKPS